MKDCTIAIMSTSALLLTLVLGFITQKVLPVVKGNIALATVAFYFAIGFGVVEFISLLPIARQKIGQVAYVLFIVQIAFFVIGMGGISWAIMGSLS
jgi:hypothetical protein